MEAIAELYSVAPGIRVEAQRTTDRCDIDHEIQVVFVSEIVGEEVQLKVAERVLEASTCGGEDEPRVG